MDASSLEQAPSSAEKSTSVVPPCAVTVPPPRPRATRASVTAAGEVVSDPMLTRRKALLAQFVRGVVATCAMVCVAGFGSKVARAYASHDGDVATAVSAAGIATRDLPATRDALVVTPDALSDRTVRSMHVEERRAVRGKKAARSRYTW